MVQKVSGFIQFLQPLYCFFSVDKFSGNTVAFVTANSRIPYWRKYFRQPPYSQHTPKTLAFHRQRFSLCLWRVLKIPKQSIFFPPSIPLSFQPLVTSSILFTIAVSWKFCNTPFFCELVSPFCQSFPKFLQSIAGIHFSDSEQPVFSAVYTLPSPRTGA